MKNIFVLSILFLFLFTNIELSNAQSVSNSAENLFTNDATNNTTEEVIEGIKDVVSQTDREVTKTIGEIEDSINLGSETDMVKESTNTNLEEHNNESDNPMENIIVMTLKDGPVVIELKPEVAPNHVARIKELVREGFYNGIVFHRVIDGFMAQGGDPTGTGRGGSGQNIDAEFNNEKHIRGTLSMARAADPNSADSQFFIVLEETPHLDGNYTVFGQVKDGMDFVDLIKKGYGPNGIVSDPDKIISMQVAADIDEASLPASLKEAAYLVEEEDKAANDNSTNSEADALEAEAN